MSQGTTASEAASEAGSAAASEAGSAAGSAAAGAAAGAAASAAASARQLQFSPHTSPAVARSESELHGALLRFCLRQCHGALVSQHATSNTQELWAWCLFALGVGFAQ